MKIFAGIKKALYLYFKARPWLVMWSILIIGCLTLLAAAGQIHTQGNGYPTIYEASVITTAIFVWLIAKFRFKTDLMEEYVLGWIFGIQWEFLTNPYWTYLPGKFNILVWQGKTIPLLGLCGWGTIFTVTLLASNWIGKKVFHLSGKGLLLNWKILVCDAIAIQVMGSLSEWSYGILLHCWDYNINFGMGKSPLGLGWEIHIGYFIVFFWYGTTMRVWKLRLEHKI